MIQRYALALLLIIFWQSGYGQDRVGAYVLGQGGRTVRGQTSGAIGEVAAGVRIDRLKLGVASGIDNVGVTSIPLLLDVRYGFGKTWSLFSQQGWNFVTQKDDAPLVEDRWPDTKYGSGAYWMSGVSWKIPVGKAGGFLVSAGCNYKRFVTSNLRYITTPVGLGPFTYYKTTNDKAWSGVVMVGWEW